MARQLHLGSLDPITSSGAQLQLQQQQHLAVPDFVLPHSRSIPDPGTSTVRTHNDRHGAAVMLLLLSGTGVRVRRATRVRHSGMTLSLTRKSSLMCTVPQPNKYNQICVGEPEPESLAFRAKHIL